ncbi:MAG: sulfatase-like hydrolase/transferase [Eubacteriaceae bacterium]|nr:sulfatase-like hydrolase/transferase [Eubacteriaceae bacterium]
MSNITADSAQEQSAVKNDKKIIIKSVLEEAREPFFMFLYFFFTLSYLEILIHLCVYGNTTAMRIYPIVFSLPVAMLLSALASLGRGRARKIICILAAVLVCFTFGAQFVYFRIFGSFFSISQLKMGGDAITSFWKETVSCIKSNIITLVLFVLPLILGPFLLRKTVSPKKTVKQKLVMLGAMIFIVLILHLIGLVVLEAAGTGSYTAYETYHSPDISTDKSVKSLGVITTARLETYYMLSGKTSDAINNLGSEDTGEEDADVDYDLNVIEGLDFAALNSKAWDSDIEALNNYLATQKGSYKNKYTGLFEGKNVITICAESFSPYLIDKDLMPTLYRLANGGIVFTNFYNSFPNTTTNGEYAMMTGLLPDFTRYKFDASMQYSIYCDMPYVLGNVYKDMGGKTFAYHNYMGFYYEREDVYPHFGYDKVRFMDDGMTFSDEWPASDLEMMEQSIDDYINEDFFTVHYMTFSGHYQYDFDVNPMCGKNYDYTKDLDYGYAVRAYISCNYELEKALEYLVARLEMAGKLDDTVIVLTGDHYPYGLEEEEYNELAGKSVDTVFGKYWGSFICFNSEYEDEPIVCDNYCCNIDILPTLLNLLGYDYDSRLLMGTDALSEGVHVAILADGSFLTDRIRFDADANEVYFQDGTANVSEGYIEAYKNIVSNKFTISNAILYNDYYYFLAKNFTPPEEAPTIGEDAAATIQSVIDELNAPEEEEDWWWDEEDDDEWW